MSDFKVPNWLQRFLDEQIHNPPKGMGCGMCGYTQNVSVYEVKVSRRWTSDPMDRQSYFQIKQVLQCDDCLYRRTFEFPVPDTEQTMMGFAQLLAGKINVMLERSRYKKRHEESEGGI